MPTSPTRCSMRWRGRASRPRFALLPSIAGDDLTGDLRRLLALLAAAGIERVVAVDLTRDEFAIPVVRVVIPGLEGDPRHPNYTPGIRARRASVSMTRAVIFAGPSLPPRLRPDDARLEWRPPVRQGDLYRAALERPAIIGVIDGYFEIVPTVWHKEILWAMEAGIHVYGAASIGALRAAELDVFGMRGIGRIYEDFRDGVLEDDDEVAVLHGPEELGYPPLTEAMVNIRATFEAAVRSRRDRRRASAPASPISRRPCSTRSAATRRCCRPPPLPECLPPLSAGSRLGCRRAGWTASGRMPRRCSPRSAPILTPAPRRCASPGAWPKPPHGARRWQFQPNCFCTSIWHAGDLGIQCRLPVVKVVRRNIYLLNTTICICDRDREIGQRSTRIYENFELVL